MKTYEKYLTEIGTGGGHPGGGSDFKGMDTPSMISKKPKYHIMQYVRTIEGLGKVMKNLESDLKQDAYKEWKKMASINKNYKKFSDNFVDKYFSRH